jgi:hypothetical protein
MNQFNSSSCQKIIKYILMGSVVLLAARYIPEHTLPNKEVIMIGASSSIIFGMLDMISPSVKIHHNKKLLQG